MRCTFGSTTASHDDDRSRSYRGPGATCSPHIQVGVGSSRRPCDPRYIELRRKVADIRTGAVSAVIKHEFLADSSDHRGKASK